MIVTLRVANYRNSNLTLNYNTFAITNKISTIYPKTNISDEINESVMNKKSEKIIANINTNNVKEVQLVFDLNKNMVQTKDILFNVISKSNTDNKISIDL